MSTRTVSLGFDELALTVSTQHTYVVLVHEYGTDELWRASSTSTQRVLQAALSKLERKDGSRTVCVFDVRSGRMLARSRVRGGA